MIDRVQNRLNSDVYNTWFVPIRFVAADETTLTLRAGQVTKDWVCLYYSALLDNILNDLGVGDVTIAWDPDQKELEAQGRVYDKLKQVWLSKEDTE